MRRLVVVLLLSTAGAQETLDEASKRLLDDDPDVRLAAAGRLGALGPAAAPAVPLLADAAYDEEDVVARAAIDALGRIGPAAKDATRGLRDLAAAKPFLDSVVERTLRATGGGSGGARPPQVIRPGQWMELLLAALEHEDPRLVATAALAIGRMAPLDPEAAKALAPLVDRPEACVRMHAIWALTLNPAADPVFLTMLKDPRVRRRRVATQHCFGPESLPQLRRALKDKDLRVRRGVIRSLSSLGAAAAPALPDLLAVLEDGDPALAEDLDFQCLGRIAPDRVVPALIRQLGAASAICRASACKTLGQLGEHAAPAVPSLVQACFDEETQVASDAVSALRNLGAVAKEAAPYLAELFDADPEWAALSQAVLQAIDREARLPPPPDSPDFATLRAQLAEQDAKVAGFAAFTLGRLSAKDAATLDALAAALDHPAPYARRHAALALQRIGPPSLPVLARVAGEGHGSARRLAVAVLPKLAGSAPDAVLPVALELIGADDPYMRREAIRAVGLIGPPAREATKGLMECLRSDRPEIVGAAVWALGRMQADVAVPMLVKLLALRRGDDQSLVTCTLIALGEIGRGAESAVPAIAAEARRPDDTHSLEAIHALVAIGAPGQAEVVKLLREEPGINRNDTIQLLMASNVRPPGIKEALDEAMKDPDANVRQTALLAACGLEPADRPGIDVLIAIAAAEPVDRFWTSRLPEVLAQVASAQALLKMAGDGDERVRSAALRALSLKGPEIVPALVSALRSDDRRLRANVACVLGGFGVAARDAIPALREAALADPEGALAFVSAIARVADVATIAALFGDVSMPMREQLASWLAAAGEDALPFLDNLRQHPDEGVRRESVELRASILRSVARSGAVSPDLLIEGLKDAEPVVRASAACGLGKLGEAAAPALPMLCELLRDPDAQVRRAAATTLGELHVEAAQPGLEDLLRSDQAEDRMAAGRALASFGAAAAPALASIITDDDGDLRRLAQDALVEMGKSAIPALATLLEGDDATAQHGAANVLAEIGEPAAARLASSLRHKDPDVRRESAWALGSMHGEAAGAVPDLVAALDDPDPLVVPQAAWALGQIGPEAKDALPALEKLAKARKHSMIVADAIRRIRGS